MEKQAFHDVIEKITRQFEQEGLEYAMVVLNSTGNEKESMVAIRSNDQCKALADSLFCVANAGKEHPRCFVGRLVINVLATVGSKISASRPRKVKKDIQYN